MSNKARILAIGSIYAVSWFFMYKAMRINQEIDKTAVDILNTQKALADMRKRLGQ